jgi:hypothetical protein
MDKPFLDLKIQKCIANAIDSNMLVDYQPQARDEDYQ